MERRAPFLSPLALLLGCLFLIALIAPTAEGQRSTATIRGTVTDPSGAVVPGAAVTLTREETGFSLAVATNSAGDYVFAELAVGRYGVRVEHAGFRAAAVTGIVLNVADVRAIDVRLETGEIAEAVTVEVPAVAVQTVGGDVSGLVTGEQARELPLNGGNFLQLTLLQPGVVAVDYLNVRDKGLLGGADLSVSGNSVTANMWTVDGVNNNDVGSNRTLLIYPSVEAIEEFKIHRNSYGAEFGQASGAQINVVTRGGTNEFHGSTFYFNRNDALAATSYFTKQAGQDEEALSRHDFGWALGGPILRDRLHFFASQEWNREVRGDVRTAFVPTAAERAGDFSGPTIAGCSGPAPVDPLTGQPFPGGRIPEDRLSPGGLAMLQLYALPNTTPVAGTCNNWVQTVNTPINWRQDNLRLDWTINETARLMLRYTQDSWRNDAPSLQSKLWGDDPFPSVDSSWNQPSRSFVARLTKVIGAKMTNTLQLSYSGNEIDVTRGGTDPGLGNQATAAIPAVFPDDMKLYGADRGHPLFLGAGGYGYLGNEAFFWNNQDLLVVRDDHSAVLGNHLLKAGVLASWNRKNEDTFGGGSFESPRLFFPTGLPAGGPTSGNVLADFLLRDMTWFFFEFSGENRTPERWRDFEIYLSDSWKLSPRVTLDLGLRYSRLFNVYAADDKILSFQPELFDPALGADPCNGLVQPPGTSWCQEAGFQGGSAGPNRSLYDEDRKLLAPRLGIAWDVFGTGKTALRAGVGQFFQRERLSPTLSLANNPPFANAQFGLRTLDSVEEPCPGCFSTDSGAPAYGRAREAPTPNSWQWNLSLQQEVLPNTTLEVSYVGNKGTHLLRSYDVNQVRSGDANGNGVSDRLEYARTASAELRPYGVFGDWEFAFWDEGGSSIYHALQTQLVSRFGRGSQFQASYTWSRTIADITLQGDWALVDVDNPRLDRGLAATHRTHLFNSSLVLLLPSLQGKSGFLRHVLGDWQVGAIVMATSGAPITVVTGSVTGVPGGPSGTSSWGGGRPNRVPGEPCRATGGPREQWLNPDAFTLDGFELGTIGDGGRGTCEGPGLFEVDLALQKNIRLGDRVTAQLRFEVFNLFNRVNFLSVDDSMDPIGVTLDAPLESATRITGAELPSNFGQATATREPRQAQLGIKLIF
jgi:hypothetical protein